MEVPKPLGTPEKRLLHSRGLESIPSLRTWQTINQLGFVTLEKKIRIEGELLSSAPIYASPLEQSTPLTPDWLLCDWLVVVLSKMHSTKPILSWFHSNHPLVTSPSLSDKQKRDLNLQSLILLAYSIGELISWWGLLHCNQKKQAEAITHRLYPSSLARFDAWLVKQLNATDASPSLLIQYVDAAGVIVATRPLKVEIISGMWCELFISQMLQIRKRKSSAGTHHKLQIRPREARERWWGVCRRRR